MPMSRAGRSSCFTPVTWMTDPHGHGRAVASRPLEPLADLDNALSEAAWQERQITMPVAVAPRPVRDCNLV